MADSWLVLPRQRPGTTTGVIFITPKDETSVCNVIAWHKIYARFRRVVIGGRLLRDQAKFLLPSHNFH